MLSNKDFDPIQKHIETEIIRKQRADSNAAIARKDVDAVSKFWMQDFVQIAGDGSISKGKLRIAQDWKSMFRQSSPVFERLPDEVVVSENGMLAWEKGKWNYKNEKYFGNYSAMWRKVKGEWITQCELYVSLNI